jgi:catechol 2,3-dioxygenase-like lactoylglutathione lyase family enzyme
MWSGLHSVLMSVQDFDRGVDDLRRLLGRGPAWLGGDPSTESKSALFPLANTTLELRGPSAGREGLCGLRLGAEELQTQRARLQGRAIGCGEVRHESEAGMAKAPPRAWNGISLDVEASRQVPIELIEPVAGWPSVAGRPAEDSLASVVALDHVVILSADVESTRDFYARGLGIRLALDRSFEERGVRLIFFRLGGVTIEIGSRLAAEPRPEAPDRFGGLAWRVGDVAATRERLMAEGFDVSEVRVGHKPGTRVCTVRDPVHGVPTLLIQAKL